MFVNCKQKLFLARSWCKKEDDEHNFKRPTANLMWKNDLLMMFCPAWRNSLTSWNSLPKNSETETLRRQTPNKSDSFSNISYTRI